MKKKVNSTAWNTSMKSTPTNVENVMTTLRVQPWYVSVQSLYVSIWESVKGDNKTLDMILRSFMISYDIESYNYVCLTEARLWKAN